MSTSCCAPSTLVSQIEELTSLVSNLERNLVCKVCAAMKQPESPSPSMCVREQMHGPPPPPPSTCPSPSPYTGV